MERSDVQRAEPVVAGGLAGVAVALLVVVLATDGSAGRAALAALVPLAIAAALALDAWRRTDRRRAGAEAALAAAHAEVAEAVAALAEERERGEGDAERHRDERERLQKALRRAEDELGRQRKLGRRLQASRQAEREWNHELRAQIARLYDARREPTGDADVRELVLQTAIQLVEAQKGLLLSRTDADGDGDLDVLIAHGFDHDPAHSAVAQRFARRVLASDEIIREDAPAPEADSPADEEIDGLVAIPLFLRDRFHGVIVCANRPGGFEDLDDDVLLALGDHAGAALHHGRLHNELRESRRAIVRALSEAVAARDLALHRESMQLTLYSLALARELELDDARRDTLICATLLRHVGYLALPERPFMERGPLRPDERAVIELHPRIGFNVIGQVPALRDVAGAILYHHERWDGGGYPAGLAGAAIPATARALAVIEAYGAMTFDRSHRAAMSPEEACEEIVAMAGTQFDPEIAARFVELVRSGPLAVDESLADHVVEALPLNLAGQAGAGLGPLDSASVDGLTLLGNQRALHRDLLDAARDAGTDSSFAVALLQLEDLERVNAEVSYPAGDHLIEVAARNAQRTAARFGGTAYRASGRRLAVLAPLNGAHGADDVLNGLLAEFAGGPAVRAGMAVWSPGDRASEVVARARRALTRPEP